MPTKDSTAPKIESLDLCLGDLFKDFYSVPDFQREYVWEPTHVEKLLSAGVIVTICNSTRSIR